MITSNGGLEGAASQNDNVQNDHDGLPCPNHVYVSSCSVSAAMNINERNLTTWLLRWTQPGSGCTVQDVKEYKTLALALKDSDIRVSKVGGRYCNHTSAPRFLFGGGRWGPFQYHRVGNSNP